MNIKEWIIGITGIMVGIIIGALITGLVIYELNQNRRISIMERFLNQAVVRGQQAQVQGQ